MGEVQVAQLNRRRFLRGAAAVMSASVVTSSEAAAAVATVDDVVAGTLLGVSEGVATVRLFATGQEVQVILAQGADVQPGRPATSPDFSAFVVGESVALRFVPSASAGPAIATLFQSVVKSGIVEMTSASEQALATSEGRFRAGYARLSSWRGRRGQVGVTYWEDPSTGERYANAVFQR